MLFFILFCIHVVDILNVGISVMIDKKVNIKSITIYKKDINFWDDFFFIPILPLKKIYKKKLNICIC
jgi:hypothetical protein